MATHVLYSLRTGRIRRVIDDDEHDDAYLIRAHPTGQGEGREIDFPLLNGQDAYQDELNTRTGISPVNDRYACIDPLNDFQVECGFLLDVEGCGDSIRGRLLIVDKVADFEYRFLSDGTFQRCLPHIDHDIANEESRIVYYNGDGWMDVQVNENGVPPGQARRERDALIAECERLIAGYELERTDRTGTRT